MTWSISVYMNLVTAAWSNKHAMGLCGLNCDESPIFPLAAMGFSWFDFQISSCSITWELTGNANSQALLNQNSGGGGPQSVLKDSPGDSDVH